MKPNWSWLQHQAWLQPFENRRDALSATDAHGYERVSPIDSM